MAQGNLDLYSQFVTSAPGSFIAGKVGLPQPEQLRRYEAGQPALHGPVLVGDLRRAVQQLVLPVREVDRVAAGLPGGLEAPAAGGHGSGPT